MEGFEWKKPLTREQLEEESEAVKKTGDILRGIEDAPELGQEEAEQLSDRDTRRAESLENEIREAKRYIESRPGFAELRKIGEERKNMSPEGLAAAMKEFDRMFPGTRKEVEEGLEEIRVRKDALERIKQKKEPSSPFQQAA